MSYRNEIYPKETIRISSKVELDREIKRIKRVLCEKKITEENWDGFNRAIENLTVWCIEDRIYEYPGFLEHIKELKEIMIGSLTSERTILSSTAVDLLTTLARSLGTKFDSINEMLFPTFRQLFGRSNKVHVSRTVSGYKQIIQHALLPRTIPKICSALITPQRQDPARVYLAECLDVLIRVNPEDKINRYSKELESVIQTIALDPHPEVRRQARACFESYARKLPSQTEVLIQSMSRDVKKHLVQQAKSNTPIRPPAPTPVVERPIEILPRIVKRVKTFDLNERLMHVLENSLGKDYASQITLRDGKPHYVKSRLLKKQSPAIKRRVRRTHPRGA